MSERLTLLLATTYTADDLHRRIALWRSIMEAVVFTEEAVPDAGELKRTISEQAGESDQALALSWPEAVWRGVTSQSLAAEAVGLVAAAAALPVTILYLPVTLTAADVAELGKWCRTECNITLLNIKVNPQVVGGCGVVGKTATYHEQSLRTLLASRAGDITKLINAYV